MDKMISSAFQAIAILLPYSSPRLRAHFWGLFIIKLAPFFLTKQY